MASREKTLKEGGEPLCEIICAVYNKSPQTSTIPEDWKKALVVPLFKSKDWAQAANYRPISLTSQVAKGKV